MKKAIVGMFVAAMLVSFSGVAMAAPAWWNSADFETQLTGSVENTGGQGEAEGTITVQLENLEDPEKFKEVFVEFDWRRINDTDNSASFDVDVLMNWDGHPDKVSLNLVANGGPGGDGWFWFDYDYTIRPQPANETFFFTFGGMDVGDILEYEYDIRTKCFDDIVPEPAGIGVAGLALLAFRKRRS